MLEINTLKERLTSDLKAAILYKNEIAVKAIRSLRARLDNAEAAPQIQNEPTSTMMAGGIAGASAFSSEVERKILNHEDIQDIIQGEINDAKQSLLILESQSVPDLNSIGEQIKIWEKYL